MDGKEYPDDLGKSIPFDTFYQAMQDGAEMKTSQINADEFEQYFEPFLQEGYDILHVTLSSGITGVFNSANLARDLLAERYPERKIFIVSSRYSRFVKDNEDKIRYLSLHKLRHTYASISLAATSGDVKSVQESLGHSSAKMTLDIYGHAYQERKVQQAKLLEKAVFSDII